MYDVMIAVMIMHQKVSEQLRDFPSFVIGWCTLAREVLNNLAKTT